MQIIDWNKNFKIIKFMYQLVRVMDDIKRIKLISYIDMLVASLIIIGGFVIILIWSKSAEIVQIVLQLNKLGINIPIELINFFTLFILLMGIFLLIYGSERLVNNILIILNSKKELISQSFQNQLTGYHRYPRE